MQLGIRPVRQLTALTAHMGPYDLVSQYKPRNAKKKGGKKTTEHKIHIYIYIYPRNTCMCVRACVRACGFLLGWLATVAVWTQGSCCPSVTRR